MNILLWLLLGLVAGWIASVVMKTDAQQGTGGDVMLGIVGALVGGMLFNVFGEPGVTGFDMYSIIVATVGAITLIWLGRRLRHV